MKIIGRFITIIIAFMNVVVLICTWCKMRANGAVVNFIQCEFDYTIITYIILGRSSGGGVYFWKISGQGVPNFWVLLHFYALIFSEFEILNNFLNSFIFFFYKSWLLFLEKKKTFWDGKKSFYFGRKFG